MPNSGVGIQVRRVFLARIERKGRPGVGVGVGGGGGRGASTVDFPGESDRVVGDFLVPLTSRARCRVRDSVFPSFPSQDCPGLSGQWPSSLPFTRSERDEGLRLFGHDAFGEIVQRPQTSRIDTASLSLMHVWRIYIYIYIYKISIQ